MTCESDQCLLKGVLPVVYIALPALSSQIHISGLL